MANRINYDNGAPKRTLFIGFTVLLFYVSNLSAQRPSPSFGIGFQAGNPTGLSMQFYKAGGVSTDILLAYNLEDFFFLNIHGLWDVHLDRTGHFHFFYGPGGFVGIRDYQSEGLKDEVVAGVSGEIGLNLVLQRIELFGQVTPRLALTPGTYYNTGGGIGMRFFF